MAGTIRLADATRNAVLDAIATKINAGAGAGVLKVYNGTIPTDANTAVGSQTLLAELTFSDPCASAAASGVLTFSAITSDSSANATGTATWARILDSDSNVIMDVSVGSSGSVVLTFNTTSIVSGGPVAITSFTLTVPTI